MTPGSNAGHEPSDLAAMVAAMSGSEAFSYLSRWTEPLDWARLPPRVELADGARLTFEKRRRSARIEHRGGSTSVHDLGVPDRTRSAELIVTETWCGTTGRRW